MKHAVLMSVLLLSTALQAQAHYGSPCARGFRNDSYGRGIEAGYRGTDLRPARNDESCYLQGVNRGQAVRAETQVFDCAGDFETGYQRGFEVSPLSIGSSCYSAGYIAGKAALDVGARERNVARVGASCVEAYEQGVADNAAGIVSTLPTMDEPVATCYRLGHWDGPLVGY